MKKETVQLEFDLGIEEESAGADVHSIGNAGFSAPVQDLSRSEQPAQMSHLDELDFTSGDESGYKNWRGKNEEKIKAISREWGVPVNKNVQITLTWMTGEYEGMLILLEYPSTISRKRHGPLKLRLNLSKKDFELGKSNHIDFTSNEIENWKMIR